MFYKAFINAFLIFIVQLTYGCQEVRVSEGVLITDTSHTKKAIDLRMIVIDSKAKGAYTVNSTLVTEDELFLKLSKIDLEDRDNYKIIVHLDYNFVDSLPQHLVQRLQKIGFEKIIIAS